MKSGTIVSDIRMMKLASTLFVKLTSIKRYFYEKYTFNDSFFDSMLTLRLFHRREFFSDSRLRF